MCFTISQIGWRVADRVFDIKRQFDTVLDLGCGKGYVFKHFDKASIFMTSNFVLTMKGLSNLSFHFVYIFFCTQIILWVSVCVLFPMKSC